MLGGAMAVSSSSPLDAGRVMGALPDKPTLDYTYKLLQCILLAALTVLVAVAVLHDGRRALPLLLRAAR